MFVNVTEANIDLLDRFISLLGNSVSTFRYFNTRTIKVLRDHLVTILYIQNEIPVGYGHLDKEGDKVWLGIAVGEGHLGKGIGKQIMNYLIAEAIQLDINEIFLTVDLDNFAAIQLYEKLGFTIIKEHNEVLHYALKLSNEKK